MSQDQSGGVLAITAVDLLAILALIYLASRVARFVQRSADEPKPKRR